MRHLIHTPWVLFIYYVIVIISRADFVHTVLIILDTTICMLLFFVVINIINIDNP